MKVTTASASAVIQRLPPSNGGGEGGDGPAVAGLAIVSRRYWP
ncbi:hypothetical protein [Pseudomonas sp.]|nr:hypothetical protein [Pseudomonas sp.]HEX4548185.1 hypothetical protein [Pseudomonas sp.]